MNTDQVTCGQTSRNVHGRYRMTPSHSLTYVINFRDSSNCSRIQNAQPGEEIVVLVHRAQEPPTDPLAAKGTRGRDGTLFVVEITTANGGPQSFEWEYPLLKLVARISNPSD